MICIKTPNGYIPSLPLNINQLVHMGTRPTDALSIAQCVAKRRRQLERLEFALEATARWLCFAPARSNLKPSLYSTKAQAQTQRSYAQLLLETLKKEDELQRLFPSAMPLEVL